MDLDSERQWPYDATRPEILAFRSGLDPDELRGWLRVEVDSRLRKLAKNERVEVACRRCGDPVEVSRSHAEKIGRLPAPLSLDCKSPTRAAEVNAEAVRFVELLGDSAEELAAAIAALS